jgi:hypothetical protein
MSQLGLQGLRDGEKGGSSGEKGTHCTRRLRRPVCRLVEAPFHTGKRANESVLVARTGRRKRTKSMYSAVSALIPYAAGRLMNSSTVMAFILEGEVLMREREDEEERSGKGEVKKWDFAIFARTNGKGRSAGSIRCGVTVTRGACGRREPPQRRVKVSFASRSSSRCCLDAVLPLSDED